MADKIEAHLKSGEQEIKPKWITETYLLRKVGFIAAYHQNKDKFPKVTKLIRRVAVISAVLDRLFPELPVSGLFEEGCSSLEVSV